MSDNKNNHRIQADFDLPTFDEWRGEVDRLLKGAPYDKIMLTRTYEDITLQPIYTNTESREKIIAGFPGMAPFSRGSSASSSWLISQEIHSSSLKDFNKKLRHELERGQNAIRIRIDHASMQGQDSDMAQPEQVMTDGIPLSTLEDLEVLFNNINLQEWPISIKCGSSGITVAAFLMAFCQKQGIKYESLELTIETDPLYEWCRYGELNTTLGEAFNEMALLTNWAEENAPNIKTVCVDVSDYHNCGASVIQELAIVLASGLEYFRAMENRGIAPHILALHMSISVGLGPNFFLEIAKIRALRVLWNQLMNSLEIEEKSRKISVHGKTSIWNKTLFDPYNNILRTTTEAFAGILGGCDSIHVGPFDEVFRQPDEFSQRIAKNIQLILRDECHADRIIDPAGGSWYVETLTRELAEKAWKLFQKYEKSGGIIAVLKNGSLQEELVDIQNTKRDNFSGRKEKLIGINVYPRQEEIPAQLEKPDRDSSYKKRSDLLREFRTSGDINKHLGPLEKLTRLLETSNEHMMESIIDAAYHSATIGEINSTLRAGIKNKEENIEPLRSGRLSEKIERLRLEVISSGTKPVIFLANMGPVSQHKIRADFTSSFFAVAGYKTIAGPGFEKIDDAVNGAMKARADVVVICSTDDTYPVIVPELAGKIKQKLSNCMVLLAGFPKEHIDKFEKAGVDEFIHIRSRIYETLFSLSEKLGVLK